jgi:hypothetical protein
MVKNLPYFHVWFDPNKGYGHVIEDNQSWEEWFGRQVVGSMTGIAPDKWRRPRRATPAEIEANVKSFMAAFRKYDWTQMLQE